MRKRKCQNQDCVKRNWYASGCGYYGCIASMLGKQIVVDELQGRFSWIHGRKKGPAVHIRYASRLKSSESTACIWNLLQPMEWFNRGGLQ